MSSHEAEAKSIAIDVEHFLAEEKMLGNDMKAVCRALDFHYFVKEKALLPGVRLYLFLVRPEPRVHFGTPHRPRQNFNLQNKKVAGFLRCPSTQRRLDLQTLIHNGKRH